MLPVLGKPSVPELSLVAGVEGHLGAAVPLKGPWRWLIGQLSGSGMYPLSRKGRCSEKPIGNAKWTKASRSLGSCLEPEVQAAPCLGVCAANMQSRGHTTSLVRNTPPYQNSRDSIRTASPTSHSPKSMNEVRSVWQFMIDSHFASLKCLPASLYNKPDSQGVKL